MIRGDGYVVYTDEELRKERAMMIRYRTRFDIFHTFVRDLYNGIKQGYPLCCIIDFCLADIIHRKDIDYIGQGFDRPCDLPYVPCSLHYWRKKK